MWLEHELLSKPESKGFFCVSTSYRQEPNAIPGRHDIIFPMFEFEMPGDINDLKDMEYELCEYLGFGGFGDIVARPYSEWQKYYGLSADTEMEAEHELKMHEEFGSTMITDFPEMTSPFWNMARNSNGTSKKIDVILGGMETIGSAERSTDVAQMRDTFHTITDGAYSNLLFDLFGKNRVETELEEFLKFDFFPRVGGGIGMTRMIAALDTQMPLAA
jgi:aspartyl/asparaginyl-tRNA synthetase